eukprot:CAMPEP_0205819510 /NCGR_PEP_ID=MMETSP0206-20130828/1916_1 /ASSEMBLY_ACC=CAM_ASM_000279 /TAXON_ID=36767 /ORGANISM="Euplotes focardii, Strain TN1" /LENGTH=83 /DNA_ID=CAMNT_0053113193 /DNA_START=832 /DNA_END=1083 /DNA_ORIENTATION=-
MTIEGSFELGDKASKIVEVKSGGDKASKIVEVRSVGEVLVFTIEWKERGNRSIPMQSEVNNKEMRKWDPHLLLAYYESKLKIV